MASARFPTFPSGTAILKYIPFEVRSATFARMLNCDMKTYEKNTPYSFKNVNFECRDDHFFHLLDEQLWVVRVLDNGQLDVCLPSNKKVVFDATLDEFMDAQAKWYLSRNGTTIQSLMFDNCFPVNALKHIFDNSNALDLCIRDHVPSVEFFNLLKGRTIKKINIDNLESNDDFKMRVDWLQEVSGVKLLIIRTRFLDDEDGLLQLNVKKLVIVEVAEDMFQENFVDFEHSAAACMNRFLLFVEKIRNGTEQEVGTRYEIILHDEIPEMMFPSSTFERRIEQMGAVRRGKNAYRITQPGLKNLWIYVVENRLIVQLMPDKINVANFIGEDDVKYF